MSVIIPSYNRAYCLARAIESVLQQSYQAKTIVVVDDGSTDDTEVLVKHRYPQVIYYKQKNKGVSAARNLALSRLTTNWVAFLDSDDEWLPNKLEQQVALLANNDGYKICHTEELWVRNGKRVNQMAKHKKSGGWIFEKCLPLCVISPSSVLMHKSLFYEIGFFREDFPACEDYDLWLKICALYPVLYVTQPCIVKYGGHDDQLSRKYWGMDRFRIQSLLDLLQANILDESQAQLTKKMMNKKIEIYLKGARKRGKTAEIVYYESLLVSNR
ncbi:MAG TPA: glycosyltransferase family 2 protein [Gammaproteobacteria bacterium]|nr:glycosyltransferase family 2 protein [Gammaproteobacteria bacterium]